MKAVGVRLHRAMHLLLHSLWDPVVTHAYGNIDFAFEDSIKNSSLLNEPPESSKISIMYSKVKDTSTNKS